MTALIGDWETLTYRELQEVLRNEKDGGSDVRCKLNATKDDLMYECDRLIDSGDTVADRFSPIEDETLRVDYIAPFTPHSLSNFEGIEAEVLDDWWLSSPLTCDPCNYQSVIIPTVPTIPQPLQYLQEFFGDETPFTNEVWENEPFTLPPIAAFEATTPTTAPASMNHGSAGLALIVLFLQALQLVLTVAIPLLIQVATIGRKTFDAVAVALQSEQVLRLVDAS